MRFTFGERKKFTLGVMFDRAAGFFVGLGWIGFSFTWFSLEDVLGLLPTMRIGDCKTCGSKEFTRFNLRDGEVVDCNHCGGYEGGPA